jgi:hypothetical protein
VLVKFPSSILFALILLTGTSGLAAPVCPRARDDDTAKTNRDQETSSEPREDSVSDSSETVLPEWLKLGGQFRLRAEGRRDFRLQGLDDNHMLSRFRARIGLCPASWLELTFEGQDSRVASSDLGLSKLEDPVDVKQAHAIVDLTRLRIQAGRQVLTYGTDRLIGASNWSNTSRSFDGVKLQLALAGGRLDFFASSVVQVDPNRWNERKKGENLFGAYTMWPDLLEDGNLDVYFLTKTIEETTDSVGRPGNATVYTTGARLVKPADQESSGEFDLSLEAAKQWGDIASQNLSAWAGYVIVGMRPRAWRARPRFSAEFSYASGDKRQSSETVGTFDQLYPTNHSKYGIVDMVGWRNIQDLRLGMELNLLFGLKVSFDYHSFWLASAYDHLYSSSGSIVVPTPEEGAADRHVGQETDITALLPVKRYLVLGAGYGHLFAGPYLRENTEGLGTSFAYAFVQLTL